MYDARYAKFEVSRLKFQKFALNIVQMSIDYFPKSYIQ